MKRPIKRKDCINGLRPCPWVGCRYHLIWDAMKINQDTSARLIIHNLMKMKETCALDVADNREATLQEIAEITGRTRELIRQVEGRKPFGKEGSKQGAILTIKKKRHREDIKKLREYSL